MKPATIESRKVEAMPGEPREEREVRLKAVRAEGHSMLLERLEMMERQCWRMMQPFEDRAAAGIVQETAHKLANALEIFGLKQGSRVAAALEELASDPKLVRQKDSSTIYMMLAELRNIVRAKL